MSEKDYDDEIAPELLKIAEICAEKGMAFVACVEYEPDKIGTSLVGHSDAGLAITMLRMCAASGVNIDGYVFALKRWTREKGIDTGSSIVMKLLGKEASND